MAIDRSWRSGWHSGVTWLVPLKESLLIKERRPASCCLRKSFDCLNEVLNFFRTHFKLKISLGALQSVLQLGSAKCA
jgi:hypothetical protein